MPPRDPYDVLGLDPGAGFDEIRAAWRSLARQHHPDLTGDDPASVTRATRRMAEINAAYMALTRRGGAADAAGATEAAGGRGRRPGAPGAARGPRPADGRPTGPPPPPPTRPVTARLDLSGNVTPRNQSISPPGSRIPLRGQAPPRPDRSAPELRASVPSGPMERGRLEGHVVLEPPDLEDAVEVEVTFGKFHGHRLGEIAAFEPSYVDWLAGSARDPELSLAARVVQAELDRRGIRRAHRPARPGWRSSPFA